MGEILTKASEVYRDFTTDGVQSSGLHEPEKSDIRDLFKVVDVAAYAAQAGIKIVANTAARDAWFADNPETLVYVNNNNGSAEDPANGVYEYVAGAPRFAAGFYQGLAAVVQPLVDQVAEDAEDARTIAASLYKGFLIFPPSHNAALDKILFTEWVDGDPTKYVRVKKWYYHDSGTSRIDLTYAVADDEAGTNSFDVIVRVANPLTLAGIQRFKAPLADGSYFDVIVDLGDGNTPIGTVNNATYAQAGLPRTIVRPRDPNFVAPKGARLPFTDTAKSDYARQAVAEAWAFGVDPAKLPYRIANISLSDAATPSALFSIADKNGTIVANRQLSASAPMSVQDFITNELPETVRLHDYQLGTKSGVRGSITLNKAALRVQNVTYVAGETDLHPSRQLIGDQLRNYLDEDIAQETIAVAAGPTTLRTAVDAVKVKPGGNLPLIDEECARAHINHRLRFRLEKGEFRATYLHLPEFTEYVGAGIGQTIIVPENSNPHAMIEGHRSLKARRMTIYSTTGDGGANRGNYSWHSDLVNFNVAPGVAPNWPIMQEFKEVEFRAGPDQNTACFGCGVSADMTIRFVDCIALHENRDLQVPAAGYFFHNTGPTASTPGIPVSNAPSLIEMRGCSGPDRSGFSVFLQTLDHRHHCTLSLHDCSFVMIFNQVAGNEVSTDSARDRNCWRITGHHAGPIRYSDTDGAWVLATTPGALVEGTAAPLIFGAIDELGRGEKWIVGDRTLGARLGDCSGANSKTLTIDGVTHTFNTDLTAVNNATIIAAINGSIPADPVSAVDIQLEQYPDVGFTHWLHNDSGETIPKGRFVTLTGADTIALAGDGDPVFGWTYRAILDGLTGAVVSTREIAAAYIEGAAANPELNPRKWGIAADGLLSFAAPNKIGHVVGDVVTVW